MNPYWFIVIGAVASGTIYPWGQFFAERGFSALEITLSRPLLTSILFLPLILFKHKRFSLQGSFLFFTVYGFIGLGSMFGQFWALVLGVPIVVVVLLVYTQPVWTVLFGAILLHERIQRAHALAILLACLGVVLLLQPWQAGGAGPVLGLLLAMSSGVFYALWIISGRIFGTRQQHPLVSMVTYAVGTSVWIILLIPIFNILIPDPQVTRLSLETYSHSFSSLLLFTIIGEVIPHITIMRGLFSVPASTAGIILLLEPISAAILGSLLFAQPIEANVLLGGGFILLSNIAIARLK